MVVVVQLCLTAKQRPITGEQISLDYWDSHPPFHIPLFLTGIRNPRATNPLLCTNIRTPSLIHTPTFPLCTDPFG